MPMTTEICGQAGDDDRAAATSPSVTLCFNMFSLPRPSRGLASIE
jgi:hypothetical protein